MINRVLLLAVLVTALALAPRPAEAQGGGITIGGGVGAVLDDRRNLPDDLDDLSHKLAFVSLRLPLTGLEIRGEGLWPDDPVVDNARALIVSGVLTVPLVIVTPYLQVGYGDYNFGDPDRSKWSGGLGARLNLGTVGLFVEATRYNRIDTDLITGGIVLNLGGG